MSATVRVAVTRPAAEARFDNVAEELPVAFEYNGIAHAVMLATPADLEDFALGFSLSEGIVERRGEVFDIQVTQAADGITLHLEIASAAFIQLKQRRRSMAGRTGCGLCGAESLAQVQRKLAPVTGTDFPLVALFEGMRSLPARQLLQQATGAAHAACRVATDGGISQVREDIGRHNALDKTLGALAAEDAAPADAALIITSRASFEMVQKAAALGYGVLAAVSAPTAAAVRLANELDVTLVGFLRGTNCTIYSRPERLQGPMP
jgi:FdhD protein